MAAVEAMLASTQEAAATLAVRHGPSTGMPVDGSMMWWRTTPPLVQRRTVMLDVAMPPDSMVMVSSSLWIAALLSSLVCTAKHCAGVSTANAILPTTLHITP